MFLYTPLLHYFRTYKVLNLIFIWALVRFCNFGKIRGRKHIARSKNSIIMEIVTNIARRILYLQQNRVVAKYRSLSTNEIEGRIVQEFYALTVLKVCNVMQNRTIRAE